MKFPSPLLLLVIAGVGMAAVLGAAVMAGKLKVSPGGAQSFYAFPQSFGGLTVTTPMVCSGLGPTPDTCTVTFAVDQGAQAVQYSLTPEGVQQMTNGKYTASSSLTITAGKPSQRAVYSIVQQPGVQPSTLKSLWLGGWDNEAGAYSIMPSATSASPVRVSPIAAGAIRPDGTRADTSGCNAYLPPAITGGSQWKWNTYIRTGSGFLKTWYEYLCSTLRPVGVFGTINGPDYADEVTLYINGQAAKVGNGNFGAAQKTADVGLGKVRYTGSLATGLNAPSANNFAGVWLFDDPKWRVVPSGLRDDYPQVEQAVNSYLAAIGGQNIVNGWEFVSLTGWISSVGSFLSSPSDYDRLADVRKLQSLGGPADIRNVDLRAFTVPGATPAGISADGASKVTGNYLVLSTLSATASGNQGAGTLVTPPLDQPWGSPQITLDFSAAGIAAMGIKTFGGTPANVQVSGAATTGAGGVLTVSAQNTGGDGQFQFSATCPGVQISTLILPAPAGSTTSANLPVSTGQLTATQAMSCTATVMDLGTAKSATGSGTLSIQQGGACIAGDLRQQSTQVVEKCGVNGQWANLLTCGAGQVAQTSGSTATCVSVVGGVTGGSDSVPLPTSVPQPTAPSGGGFQGGGLPKWLLPVVILAIAVAGVVGLAFALRRRPPDLGVP